MMDLRSVPLSPTGRTPGRLATVLQHGPRAVPNSNARATVPTGLKTHVMRRCLTAWAHGKAQKVLHARAEKDGPLQALWQERQRLFQEHLARLSPIELLRCGLRQHSQKMLWMQRHVTHMMFPIADMAFHNAMGLDFDAYDETCEGIPEGAFELRPQAIITRDHTLLDGMVIRHRDRPLAQSNGGRPILLFVPPNGMIYEECLVPLCRMAHDSGADVLAFNYRGVGKSLGSLSRIEDAVDDTAAALAWACQEGAGVAVLGLSMGGGTAVAAIQLALQRKMLGLHRLDLVVLVHTFSSWRDVYAGRRGALRAHGLFAYASMLGMRDLTTAATLKSKHWRWDTSICEAREERVIPAAARLGRAMAQDGGVVDIEQAGAWHADMSFLTDRGDSGFRNDAAAWRKVKGWSSSS